MLKSYHCRLNGKMKIIRKPRPIGNELKTVSDASTHIVLHMELHEHKEDMADKEYVYEYGATTACGSQIIGKVIMIAIFSCNATCSLFTPNPLPSFTIILYSIIGDGVHVAIGCRVYGHICGKNIELPTLILALYP